MATRTKIIALLKITPEAYDELSLTWWMKYALAYSYDTTDWQKLLANSALNSFWLRQKEYRERRFIEDFGSYADEIPANDLLRKYDYEVGVKLLTTRSPALLQSARKMNVTPQLN